MINCGKKTDRLIKYDLSLLQTDCPDFTVDKGVSASPGSQAGSEVSVEVCFEPHQLGEVRGQLSLCSGIGGEYIFPLHGICLPPKAQGPFSIRAGRNITIPFKNVFLETTAFSFQVKERRPEGLGNNQSRTKVQNVIFLGTLLSLRMKVINNIPI